MREAARRNAAAAFATARQIAAGMTMRDIETLFRIETARRGTEAVFVVAGGTGLLPHGEVRRGEPLLIDAVSHYQHYHGDFGRTVVVGEPNAEVRRRVEALRTSWQASFEALRPGRRYSEIRQAGLDAIAGAGYRYLTVAHPHSVGLQHTDEPFRDDSPFELKDDIVLEQGMTLTVDFPHLDVGFGACHLEDLVEITADGARPLAGMDEPLVVV
jgi:Xaa-Pro aminopeptidase